MISSNAYFTQREFADIDLNGERLHTSEFHACRFVNCTFGETELRSCRFISCSFSRCDLSLLEIPGSVFPGTTFEDSKMIGIDWTMADWETITLGEPLKFKQCIISHSTFIGLNLFRFKFLKCTLYDVDFREANLTEVDFSGSNLADSLFANTNLTAADLSSARNYNISPEHNLLSKARFSMPEAMALLYSMDIELSEYDD